MLTSLVNVRVRRVALVAVAIVALIAATFGAAATTSSTTTDALHRKVAWQLAVFTTWLNTGGAFGHGYVGEVGWPGDDPR